MSSVRTETKTQWTESEAKAWSTLLSLAVTEDLGPGDLTSEALVPSEVGGAGKITSRARGIIAGLPAIPMTLAAYDPALTVRFYMPDGAAVAPGDVVAEIQGPARSLLSAERVVLNLLTHLSGIATLTGQFVEEIAGTPAGIYDTRKTHPGWRVLEKYAVRCGGGRNHRSALYSGVLIKDNHLWIGSAARRFSPADAVTQARERTPAGTTIEIEVDTLDQLAEVLPAGPDIVLLDNMSPEQLTQAVELRNAVAPHIQLEASGGITLTNVRALAATGIERISIGALTHSAPALDLGLDFVS